MHLQQQLLQMPPQQQQQQLPQQRREVQQQQQRQPEQAWQSTQQHMPEQAMHVTLQWQGTMQASGQPAAHGDQMQQMQIQPLSPSPTSSPIAQTPQFPHMRQQSHQQSPLAHSPDLGPAMPLTTVPLMTVPQLRPDSPVLCVVSPSVCDGSSPYEASPLEVDGAYKSSGGIRERRRRQRENRQMGKAAKRAEAAKYLSSCSMGSESGASAAFDTALKDVNGPQRHSSTEDLREVNCRKYKSWHAADGELTCTPGLLPQSRPKPFAVGLLGGITPRNEPSSSAPPPLQQPPAVGQAPLKRKVEEGQTSPLPGTLSAAAARLIRRQKRAAKPLAACTFSSSPGGMETIQETSQRPSRGRFVVKNTFVVVHEESDEEISSKRRASSAPPTPTSQHEAED